MKISHFFGAYAIAAAASIAFVSWQRNPAAMGFMIGFLVFFLLIADSGISRLK